MPFYSPPVPLFALFGDRTKSARTWVRKRVIALDEDGDAMVVCEDGDRRLVTAVNYCDFLRLSTEDDARTVMPAQPGWRCLFGYDDSGVIEVWLGEVAAWSVASDGCLTPITIGDGGRAVEPIDIYGDDTGLIRILSPTEATPDHDEQIRLATAHIAAAKAMKAPR